MSNLNTTLATLAEQKDFLAIALIRFLDLCGGADGTECGRGDPRVVRGLAVAALDRAGIAYGKSKVPLPGLGQPEDMESFYERQRDGFAPAVHVGRPAPTPPGFFSDLPGSMPYDTVGRECDTNAPTRIKPVAIVSADQAPNRS